MPEATTSYVTGDCRDVMRGMPADSIQCCVTSPPYFGLRDYGVVGQLGSEGSVEGYVSAMVEVFREVRRVLRPDGICWLNLGSSYASGGKPASPSRQVGHVPPYDNDDIAPANCSAPDCAYHGQRDEHQDGLPNRLRCTSHNDRQPSQSEPPPWKINRDNGLLNDAEASLSASLPGVPASNIEPSSMNVQDAADRVDAVLVCQPSPLTFVDGTVPSEHMSAGTSDTASTLSSSSRNKSDKAPSGWTCDCGSCGVCWAYLAIPLLRLKAKDLIDTPHLVAMALQADGWWLRSDIVWQKPNCMPESITDRPTSAHEHVFMLTKQPRYHYDPDAIQEPVSDNPATQLRNRHADKGLVGASKLIYGSEWGQSGKGGFDRTQGVRNARNVWTLHTARYKGAHFAVMPLALAERCILAGSSQAGQCPTCGSPWKRVTSRGSDQPVVAPSGIDRFGTGETGVHRKVGGQYQKWLDANPARTTGWQPSCPCPAHVPVPQTVLDPFAGSGTTAVAANALGRHARMINLNPDYRALAETRLGRPFA